MPLVSLVPLGRLSPEESLNTVYRVRQGPHQYALKWYENEVRYLKEDHVYRAIGPHPNVLPTKGVGNFKAGGFGILSPIANMDLFQWIVHRHKKENVGVAEREARMFLRQIVQGLLHAHGKGWAHCDVKPDNVFLFGDRLCLADWEAALPADSPNRLVGTLYYMPPECFFRTKTEAWKGDVWSLGVLLFNLMSGNQPFQYDYREKAEHLGDSDDYETVRNHFNTVNDAFRTYGKVPSTEAFQATKTALSTFPHEFHGVFLPEWVLAMQGRWRAFEVHLKRHRQMDIGEWSIPLKRLLSQMLCFDPDRRITLEGVLAHEWMSNPIN